MNHLVLGLMTTLTVLTISQNGCRSEESILSLFPEYQQQITEFKSKISALERQVNKPKTIVSLTGCVSKYTHYSAGTILMFDDIRSTIGINDITGYKSRGVFVAEVKGLYLVIVSVSVHDSGSEIGIYRNGHVVTKMYKGGDNINWETGSTSAALMLEKGDRVWVQVTHATRINLPQISCLTIVKVQ